MEGQNRPDRRFDKLYEQYVPALYRAALYLLGDREAAAQAAECAWLEAVRACGDCDERAFPVEYTRLLLGCCDRLHRGVDYQIDEVAPSLSIRALELLLPLSRLGYSERRLVVLSAVQGFSPAEIARILCIPPRLVEARLQHAVGKLCRKTVAVPAS